MSKLMLPKVAGISAVLTTMTVLPWVALPFIAPAMGIKFPQSLNLGEWARVKVEHHSVFQTVDWLVIACLVFEMVAVVGFFYVLRRVGPLTWLGLAAWLTGLQLVMFEHVVVLGIDAAFMPNFLAATDSAKPALEVLASTLNRIRLIAATIGNSLILGVGVPIFALATLSIRQVPKWIGWLGVSVGALKWLPLHYWPSPAFVGFMLWLVAMGVTWLRLKEPIHLSGDHS